MRCSCVSVLWIVSHIPSSIAEVYFWMWYIGTEIRCSGKSQLSAGAEHFAESMRLTRISHVCEPSLCPFCQNPHKGMCVEWQVWGSPQSNLRGSIALQAVSGITPDFRASCMAPNPPFLEMILAASQELSVWEQAADDSFSQKEGIKHCSEAETCGTIQ